MPSAQRPGGIKRKLQLIAAFSLLAVLALAGSSAYFAARTEAAAHLLLQDGIVGTTLASRLELLLQKHRGLVGASPAELDRSRLEATRTSLRALDAEILAEVAGVQASRAIRSASWAALAGQLERELPTLFNVEKRVVDLAYNFVQDQSLAVSQGPYAAIFDRIGGQISQWRDRQAQIMDDQVSGLLGDSDYMVNWICWSTTTTLVVGCIGAGIVGGMLKRLQGVQHAMLRLAGRDSAVVVPFLADGDEIGAMARAVQAFKHSVQQVFVQDADLRLANLRFETALSNMSQGLCQYDADGRLAVVNQRFLDIYHLEPGQVRVGVSFRDVLQASIDAGNYPGRTADELVDERQAFVDQRASGVVLQMLGDGRVVAISHSPMQHGGWVATYEDVTERRSAEARVSYLARHDVLTGLPNRMVLNERLDQVIAEAGRGIESAVLCLDLDHFKAINDTLGHPIGDQLLTGVADRLAACVREGDTVARLGGDEFAVIQAGISRPEEAKLLAERIVVVLQAPFLIDGHQIMIGVSVGLALVPGNGTSAATLLKNADMALYRAKLDGRGGFCFFEPEMDARLQHRRQLELDLRRAVLAEEFVLFYQPLVNLDRNEVSGFEALLRWPHPERGMVSPGEFIPVAEEIGVIVALGEWVIRRACADAALWPGGVNVAVNLSPVQFRSNNLVPTVVAALAESGLAPGRLELEITESVLLQNSEPTLGMLHELRALGIRISMDDFGTGYSSLSYLRSFPFDKLKIDQSFIRDLSTREDCVHIVRAVQGLCAGLGIATIAEGVETEDQLARLLAEGCREVQGFLFSQPRCVAEVPSIVRRISQMPKRDAQEPDSGGAERELQLMAPQKSRLAMSLQITG